MKSKQGYFGRVWDALRGKRSFEAARPSRIASGFGITPSISINEQVRWELRGLLNHSRQQGQNNDYLAAYFKMVRRHLVGPNGIRLQVQAREPNGDLDNLANTIIENAWRDWGKIGNPSVDGQHSWLTLQWLAAETVARDGNMLFRIYRGPQFGKYGFRLQPLEVDFLAFDRLVRQNDGTSVRMGIEFDRFQKPAAYHLYRAHPGDMNRTSLTMQVERVPASDIVHVFRSERPGQLVGVPWAYTALRRLNMTKGYEEAAITAARVGAAKMGFYVQNGAESMTPDPDLLDRQEATDTGHLMREVEPGIIESLPPGVTYQEHNPAYPTGEFGQFMKAILRGAAAGLGVSYASLANDLEGANFSSLRAGQAEERDEWRTLQEWFSQHMHERIAREWLPTAMVTGAIPLPIGKLDKFSAFEWRPRGWAYVSPTDESTANQRDMASMLKSPQEIVAERGTDLDTVFEQISEAKKLASTYGLDFNPQAPGHETGPAAPPVDPAAATDAATPA